MNKEKHNMSDKMKSIKESTVIHAVLMNLLVFVVFQIAFKPMYETNDDNYISSIAYGVFGGGYDSHLVYMNILLGKIYKALLSIVSPDVPWYAIIQYALLFISFSSILYIFLFNNKTIYRWLFCWIFIFFYGYECYVKVQYSKTTGIVTAAGILLIYTSIKEKKIKKIVLALGILLTICASLYRFEVFCMMLPVVGSIVIVDCFYEIVHKRYRLFLRCCTVFIPVFIICFLGEIYDVYQYQNDQEWNEYREWDNLRIQLLDYGFPDYEENKEVYESLEISKTDYQLYKKWNYADTKLFTKKTMEKLIEVKKKPDINLEFVKNFVVLDLFQMVKYPYFQILIMLYIVWILSERKNKALILLSTVIGVIIQFYFFYINRYLINRINMSVVLGLSIVLILNIQKFKFTNLIRNIIISFFSVFSLIIFFQSAKEITVYLDKENAVEVFNLISNDKENLYLIENYTNNNLWTSAFQIWDVPTEGISSNYLTLGGWRYPTPLVKNVLENYHVENPYADMVNNETVYLICDFEEYGNMILQHIRDHYDINAYMFFEKEINGHKIYRIFSEKKE